MEPPTRQRSRLLLANGASTDHELAAFDGADAASAHGLRAQLAEHGYALIDLGESADCAEADAFAAAERLFAEIERSEVVRAATTSELDPARRGYAGPLTENFASLAGQAAANDHVRKFRVGPDAGAAHDEPGAPPGFEREAARTVAGWWLSICKRLGELPGRWPLRTG